MVAVDLDSSTDTVEMGGRARILREARQLFTAQGFASVSMQQIADAATINKATLYHHFRDKEDLFVSVMAVEFSRMATGLAAVIAEPGLVRERLQRIARHMFAVQQSDFGRLSSDLRAHVSAERLPKLLESCTPPWEQIRRVIADGIASGEVRAVDTELAGRAFFAMVGSQIWWSKFGAGDAEPDDLMAQALADLLIAGIGSDTAGDTMAGDALAGIAPTHDVPSLKTA